jgi:acyl-CoA dehydrogenase
MLMATVNADQRERYLAPYVQKGTVSAIGISEPGAGGDPAMMTTRAVRDGDDWVINGRKIWISRAADADFTILMAVTDKAKGARGGISAFLVDKGTPGFNVLRKIPMLGGQFTYEVALEDCRVPHANLLGTEGQGFAPMQVRLSTRRLQMASWSIGMAERALQMMLDYAPQRITFGEPLSQRQSVQWWITDAATEMAYEVLDHAMQLYGAMGVTKELPLSLMQAQMRTMRIYDGPTEVHKWVVARNLLGLKR